MTRSILCISGFAFNLFSGDLISAPSNPYLAHLQWVENELTRVGEHIKASRITHLINASYTFNECQFDWDDSIYPASCEVIQFGLRTNPG